MCKAGATVQSEVLHYNAVLVYLGLGNTKDWVKLSIGEGHIRDVM